MKSIFEQVIARGGYDLAALLGRIDRYHVEGKLSDAERDALYALARQDAVPQYDTADEIGRLWTAVHALQTAMQHGAAPEQPVDAWPEWEQRQGAHDAYRSGDQVSYRGKRYICAMLTTYAPDVYPAAWHEAA